jgi:hypothetical protein
VYGVHNFFYGTKGVSIFQQVLGESGFAISVLKVAQVFLKSGIK